MTISPVPPSVSAQARFSAPPNQDEARSQRKTAAPSAAGSAGKTPPSPPQLIASRSIVELDVAAGRYVQTHFNAADDSIISRYPSESQLAFSRGVNAYFRAAQRA